VFGVGHNISWAGEWDLLPIISDLILESVLALGCGVYSLLDVG
jgi:hypothetical protein